MSARVTKPDTSSRSYKAMLLALTGEVSVQAAAERYGLSATTVYNAIARERERQRDANPEDELTC